MLRSELFFLSCGFPLTEERKNLGLVQNFRTPSTPPPTASRTPLSLFFMYSSLICWLGAIYMLHLQWPWPWNIHSKSNMITSFIIGPLPSYKTWPYFHKSGSHHLASNLSGLFFWETLYPNTISKHQFIPPVVSCIYYPRQWSSQIAKVHVFCQIFP